MALLSVAKRREYFKVLGLGDYKEANIYKFQNKYFTRKIDQDGIYGVNTDALLRHVYNVNKYTTHFSPAEFKCECCGKYCTGYPTYMRPSILKFMQSIRTKYNRAVYVSSGLRCKRFNTSLNGSSSRSKHMEGLAVDYYIHGVTYTLSDRIIHIKMIRTWKNHDYSYSDGYDSLGYRPQARYMGVAVHTQTK